MLTKLEGLSYNATAGGGNRSAVQLFNDRLKGVIKFFILYKVFDCLIVHLFNDWLQGRVKFAIMYKVCSIVQSCNCSINGSKV